MRFDLTITLHGYTDLAGERIFLVQVIRFHARVVTYLQICEFTTAFSYQKKWSESELDCSPKCTFRHNNQHRSLLMLNHELSIRLIPGCCFDSTKPRTRMRPACTEGGGKKSPPPPHVSAIAKTSKLGINYMPL